MSTNVIRAGITCFDLAISASFASRASGTDTSPTFGSIVQNGKFAACAAAVRVSALKSVDFPTFGSPTMPVLKPMRCPFAQRPAHLKVQGLSFKPQRSRMILRSRRSSRAWKMISHANTMNIGWVSPPEKISAGIQTMKVMIATIGLPASRIDNGGRSIASK